MVKKRILISTLVIIVFSIFIVGFIKVIGAKTIEASWGLGTKVTEAVSNNREYDWYIDQFNTGESSDVNCGPTSIEMVMKWKSKDSSITAEEIRNKYLLQERYGMELSQVASCLKDNNITIRFLQDVTEEKLKDELKLGNIIIVGMDLSYIPYNMITEERVGKYFDGNTDHYVVIKGYKVVDDKLYFETYDPGSLNNKYIDGTPIGRDRYYLAKELVKATVFYKDWMIVVDK
jgi:uncharacterized protein YnzC (UPF0291/DUF896 family)